MGNEAERILEAAMKLPDSERAQVAAILADSIGDGHTHEEIEGAWIAEARLRLERIRSGESKTTPWDQVNHKLQSMLDQARHRRASAG